MATMKVQNVQASDKTVKQPQNGTQTYMSNKTPFVMSLDRSNNWSGEPVGPFPATIAPNGTAIFTHLKGNFFGSKGVVVYKGKNATNVDCAWALAWHAPADTSASNSNRVYVVCGTKQAVDNMSFDQIQQKLDTGLTSDNATDSSTKTQVDANIHDLAPEIATLSANFGLTI